MNELKEKGVYANFFYDYQRKEQSECGNIALIGDKVLYRNLNFKALYEHINYRTERANFLTRLNLYLTPLWEASKLGHNTSEFLEDIAHYFSALAGFWGSNKYFTNHGSYHPLVKACKILGVVPIDHYSFQITNPTEDDYGNYNLSPLRQKILRCLEGNRYSTAGEIVKATELDTSFLLDTELNTSKNLFSRSFELPFGEFSNKVI